MKKNSQVEIGIFCVELVLPQDEKKPCIFDDYEEARLFLYAALDGLLENMNVQDANMWKL